VDLMAEFDPAAEMSLVGLASLRAHYLLNPVGA
jgi:hypothetical protein